jgi:hypothetical protein
MIGAPAIAARAGPNGKRLAVVPLPANDALVVFDAESGAPLHTIRLGVEPIAAVIASDSRAAYVSDLTKGETVRDIGVTRHPTALVWGRAGRAALRRRRQLRFDAPHLLFVARSLAPPLTAGAGETGTAVGTSPHADSHENVVSRSLPNSRGGTRTHDPGIMSAVL